MLDEPGSATALGGLTMPHVPHLLLVDRWGDRMVGTDRTRRHHLTTVLRLAVGDPVTYTDGAGRVGEGRWVGDGVERGVEHLVPVAARAITLAVAAPDARERQRFLVEKLAELGVARIRWLRTTHGGHRPPPQRRAQQWADAALEQSQGAHRTLVDSSSCRIGDIDPPLLVAERGGGPPHPPPGDRLSILVGPEGGWAPGEIEGLGTVHLTDRILRVETAAVLAAFALRG